MKNNTDTTPTQFQQKSKLGVIPEGWKIVRFRDIAKFNPKIGVLPDRFIYIDLESVKNGVLRKEIEISKVEAPSRAQRVLQKEDILFQTVRPYQKNNLFFKSAGDYVASSGYAQLRARKCAGFIYQLIYAQYINNQVMARCTGTSFPAISAKDLAGVYVKLPPLLEQQKIASILNTWDKAIAAQEKLIAQKQELKKGLMQQLLTGNKRFAEFEDIWVEVKLDDVCDFKNGKGHEQFIDSDGNYVVVNSKFISSDGTVRKYTKTQASALFKNDIVMVMSDVPNGKALAKCFLIDKDEKFSLNQRICSLTPKNINTKFLYYQLNRNRFYLKFNDGLSQTNLKKKEVLNCPILLPSPKEQEKIVLAIEASNNMLQKLEVGLINIKKQKQGLMQQLLDGGKRVKI